MPYIKKEDREALAADGYVFTAGELNYAFTRLMLDYLQFKGEDYQSINDCIGALESCKLEFYRRIVVPYENKKIKENGDVFVKNKGG